MRTWLTIFLMAWSILSHASILNSPRPQSDLLVGTRSALLLPAEQAFVASLVRVEGDTAFFELQVAPGYYAYRDKIFVQDATGKRLAGLSVPEGKVKSDPEFGDVQVLEGIVPLTLSPAPSGQVALGFQGCAARGVCYPAMSKVYDLGGTSTATAAGVGGHSIWWFLLAGLGLALTPCVLPTLPLLLRVVAGNTQSKARNGALAAIFVLASAVGYALLGMLVSLLGGGSQLQAHLQNPVVIVIATGIFLLLAFTLLEVRGLSLRLPNIPVVQGLYLRMSGGSVAGAAGLGLVSTFVLSPCVSAPLAGILLYLAQGGNALQGALELFVLGLGMGMPMMIIALGGQAFIPRGGAWLSRVKEVYAVLMLLTAAAIFSRILNPQAILALVGVVTAGLGGWLYSLAGCSFGIRKTLASILTAFALASFLGAWQGHEDPARPWVAPAIHLYTEVNTLAALQAVLNSSKQAKRPVMIYVSAKWCLNCKVVEARLTASDMQGTLKAAVDWVKLDITESSTAIQGWLADRHLFGPPALIFLNGQGEEQTDRQLVGEIESAQLKKALEGL
ncbi:protein-disulfide reductase DsbD [Pseudomonas taiwanensis]|uniref:protein-disulfide reductase DsbD n=1 Tax=Pseudomonas taiwanensis TaxID=470150 RepID=UPI0028E04346|nr:protein-disulfide reductase DsbD [Pseudomonas taiwanensis]MDT8925402.1 protein-disulfide reductase DsbD [Pseudomonas taiwanensis]